VKVKCIKCEHVVAQKPDDVWRETCPECGGSLEDEQDDTRRIKVIHIPLRAILLNFCSWRRGGIVELLEFEDDELREAASLSCYSDPSRLCVSIVLEHPNWEPVEPGTVVPEWNENALSFQYVQVPVESQEQRNETNMYILRLQGIMERAKTVVRMAHSPTEISTTNEVDKAIEDLDIAIANLEKQGEDT